MKPPSIEKMRRYLRKHSESYYLKENRSDEEYYTYLLNRYIETKNNNNEDWTK
jgi:hypothetical protein